MALSPGLRNKLLAAAGSGALLISTLLLKDKDGLEGRQHRPYQDVAGILTVCDGHTGNDIVPGKYYSNTECDALLHADLLATKQTVDRLVSVPLNEYQRAALYSFAFNVGSDAFRRSTLLRKLNAGDRPAACNELRRWIYARKRVWRGLVERRETERMLCLWGSTDELNDH